MTDIDKAVELARSILDPMGARSYEIDAMTLARAVLAMAPEMERLRFLDSTSAGCMAPVVRAARAWAASEGNAFGRASVALRDAVATLDAEARRG